MNDRVAELQRELERLKKVYETERDPFERAGIDVQIQDIQAEITRLRKTQTRPAAGSQPERVDELTLRRLIAALQNKEEYSTTGGFDEAGQQLVAMGAAAVPALLDLLKTGNATGRGNAARLLGYIREPLKQILPALERCFKADADQEVRRIAGRALGDLGAPALPVLVEGLRRGDPSQSEVAAQAIIDLGPAAAPAVPALVEALRGDTRLVRSGAADALGAVGAAAAQAIPALARALDDNDPLVRKRVAAALGAIGKQSAQALPQLLASLRDTNPEVRAFAARSIGRIGTATPEVLAALREVLNREEELFPREELSYALMVLEKR